LERPDQLQNRLNNIAAVEPILTGLKTLSSGTRLRALKQARRVDLFQAEVLRVLSLVVPHFPLRPSQASQGSPDSAVLLLVVGSEHGLCGAFNEALARYGQQLLEERVAAGCRVNLVSLGTRLERAFRQRAIVPLRSDPLSLTALPSYDFAWRLSSGWLQSYERREIDSVIVTYNAYLGLGRHEPRQVQLLPPQLPELDSSNLDWTPIIETDPLGLFVRTVELWLSANLYAILLDSAAAEHAARYRILDGAVQNAERMTEELQLLLQSARQEAITAELQDLAIGAGLLG
jgi:F-type H+-transporting ATPase subunit gamma